MIDARTDIHWRDKHVSRLLVQYYPLLVIYHFAWDIGVNMIIASSEMTISTLIVVQALFVGAPTADPGFLF